MFGNSNPVYLEVGCGKGGFIIDYASRNKDVNFLAVELLENVVVMAAEKAKEQELKNLRFFNCGADYLARYIENSSIERIFLNFSPPYPQKSYESHRLTYDRFARYYKDFLCDGGFIEQKTDDKDFFEYSKEQFLKYGFKVYDETEKLKQEKVFNIKTEYEKKFLEKGLPIYRLTAIKSLN